MLRRAFNHAQTHVYTRSRFEVPGLPMTNFVTPCLIRTRWPPMERRRKLASFPGEDVQRPPGGAQAILRRGAASGRLTHVERMPALPGRPAPWPGWVPAELIAAFAAAGISAPWEHQAAAADLARAGRSVILATGTASGKSVGYLAPALTAIGEGGTALYLAPTRALAADQLNLLHFLGSQIGAVRGSSPRSASSAAGSGCGQRWSTPTRRIISAPGHASTRRTC